MGCGDPELDMTHRDTRRRLQSRRRRADRRSGDLGRAVAWTCPCCGGLADARFGAQGRTVATCRDERCGFAGLTEHVLHAA
jgi:hypothetical protein